MRKTGYLLAAAFVVTGTLAGCTKKSENPLSPTVAGPIAGVSITAPKLLEPQHQQTLTAGTAVTLLFESATTTGERPITQELQVALDPEFTQRVHSADKLPPGQGGRTVLHAAGASGRPRLLLARPRRRRRQRRSVLAGLALPDRALGPHRDPGAAVAGAPRRHHRRAADAGGAEHRGHGRDQRDLPVRDRRGSGVHPSDRRVERAAQRRRPHRGHRLRSRPGHRVLLARQRQRRRLHGALLHRAGVPDRSASRAAANPDARRRLRSRRLPAVVVAGAAVVRGRATAKRSSPGPSATIPARWPRASRASSAATTWSSCATA